MVVISATIVVTVRPIMALTVSSTLGLHDYTAVRAPVILNGLRYVCMSLPLSELRKYGCYPRLTSDINKVQKLTISLMESPTSDGSLVNLFGSTLR